MVRAAAEVRGWLRAAWLWQFLTATEQRVLEEWLLHAHWLTRRITIYQQTLADLFRLHHSVAHRVEHRLHTLGYGNPFEWREGPQRHRRGIWLNRDLTLLLRLQRLSFPVRQMLLRHLITAALNHPRRATRHLAAHPQARTLWEAVLGYPLSTSPAGDVVLTHKRVGEGDAVAGASLPDGREPRTPKPPAPAGQHGTATPPASSPPPSGRPLWVSGLDAGEAPATEPPASGGRGEGQSVHTDHSPDGDGIDLLCGLVARGALLRWFESDDRAALRHDFHRLHDLLRPGPLPDVLPRLLLTPITAALGCTDEDADFLARWYIARLRAARRRAPPVRRMVGINIVGQSRLLRV